jgi:glycosyltransferase involved in cell wall biosynthesis
MGKLKDKKRLRVAYVGSPELFLRGASPIHVMKMCQAIARLGINVDLVLQSYDPKIDIFKCYGVEPIFNIITTIPSTNGPLRHLIHGTYSAFYVWFNKQKYDLVLSRNIIFTYLSTAFFGIPTIYDAHHPLVNRPARLAFNMFKKSKYLIRLSTNSQGLGKIYAGLGLPDDKLVVAHNGVDLEQFRNIPSKLEARKKLNLPANKKIVCYSGNIYTGRGIDLLVEVSSRLRDVLFLIVGGLESDINVYSDMVAQRKLENFKLVGFVPHNTVPLYLFAADALVIPYTSEMTIQGGTRATGFTSPLKLFEFMASCRPIVATNLPTISEILHDDINAVVVDSNSVDSLFEGIKRVLEDEALATKIALQSAADVGRYTWEERVKKILNGFAGF